MNATSVPDRGLIRKYFECLQKRRTTTESFAKQVISDLLAHWKEGRPPKEGIWIYILGVALLVSFFINPVFSLLLIVGVFFLSKMKVQPNLRPPVTDEQIDYWLKLDREKVFEKAPSQLNVHQKLQSKPVPREALNVIINRDGSITLSGGVRLENDNNDVLLKNLVGLDYFCEKGLDNRERYSIYTFTVICLCRNFLAYYKCHWNFLRGVATLVETGEYLYDTIVSINTEEWSSASLGDGEGKKIVLQEFLRIGTTDGQVIKFPGLSKTRTVDESMAESDTSVIKNAAITVRELLRQRRIDLQIVKPFEDI